MSTPMDLTVFSPVEAPTPTTSSLVQLAPTSKLTLGHYSTIGRRATNEDVEFCCTFTLHDETYSYTGVCDGHGGDSVAKFVATNLPQALQYALNAVGSPMDDSKLKEALKAAFKSVQKNIDLITAGTSGSSGEYTKGFADSTGTTVTSFLVRCKLDGSKDCYTANLGDSRTIVGSDTAVYETVDHKPEIEREIIEGTGMHVIYGPYVVLIDSRIGHGLTVSRALGDNELFGPSPDDTEGSKSFFHEPDVTKVDIPGNGLDFVILACDGLFDKITSEEVSNIIQRGLAARVHPQLIQHYLTTESMKRRSGDNISLLLLADKEKHPYLAGLDSMDVTDIQHLETSSDGQWGKICQFLATESALPSREIHQLRSGIPVAAPAAARLAAGPTLPTTPHAEAAAASHPAPPSIATTSVAPRNPSETLMLFLNSSITIPYADLTDALNRLNKEELLGVLCSKNELNYTLLAGYVFRQRDSQAVLKIILEALQSLGITIEEADKLFQHPSTVTLSRISREVEYKEISHSFFSFLKAKDDVTKLLLTTTEPNDEDIAKLTSLLSTLDKKTLLDILNSAPPNLHMTMLASLLFSIPNELQRYPLILDRLGELKATRKEITDLFDRIPPSGVVNLRTVVEDRGGSEDVKKITYKRFPYLDPDLKDRLKRLEKEKPSLLKEGSFRSLYPHYKQDDNPPTNPITLGPEPSGDKPASKSIINPKTS